MQELKDDQLKEISGGIVEKLGEPPQFDNFGRPVNPFAPILWEATEQ
jgi:hypothetical protein